MATSPIPLYTSFINSIGCEVSGEDKISFVMPTGDTTPVTLEGKDLVMPTPEMLRRMDGNLHVAYHPLSEQVMRNESPVQRKLRTIVNIKATYMLGSLMQDLTELALSDKKERTSKSDYFELFTVMKDASKTTMQSVKAVVATLEVTGLEHRLVNFASKRGGKLNGTPFRRITNVTFPILAEFAPEKPADHIFSVKMSKKDKLVIFELLKYIIPKLQVQDAYSAGSDSMDAPMFISIALAWAKFAEDINAVSWRYKDALANFTYCNTEIGYLDQLEKISSFIGFIPSMAGNEGTTQLVNKSTGVSVEVGGLAGGNPTTISPTAATSPLSPPATTGFIAPTPAVGTATTAPTVPSVILPTEGGHLKAPSMPVGALLNPGFNNGGFNNGGFNAGNAWGNNGWGGMGVTTGYLPPGTIMGTNGQPVNVLTATLDELERVLDPATYSQVYNQRAQQAAMTAGMQGVQMGFGAGMQMGYGMATNGWGTTGYY